MGVCDPNNCTRPYNHGQRMITTARELYQQIQARRPPLLLDVRNEDEFARWKVEGAHPVETLNLPYFAFVEDEPGSVAKVKDWLAGRAPELVVICAKGGSSEFVAEVLRGHSLSAQNLEGGMIAWGGQTVRSEIPSSPVRVLQILRFGKGCLSYVLSAGSDAVIVDPHRHMDEYGALLHEHGLRLRAVIDTHLHADHVSGAPALAQSASVPCFGHRDDFEHASFSFEPITDRAPLRIGALDLAPVRFLHSPGHTPGSTSLLVNDKLLLTGDTLFVGGVGRPDLAGKAAEWGRELHRTLQERLRPLGDDVLVLPAHSAGPQEARADGTVAAPLGALRQRNPALRTDAATFVEEAVRSAGAAPEAYARIREANMGHWSASEDELAELEFGKNECAMARRH